MVKTQVQTKDKTKDKANDKAEAQSKSNIKDNVESNVKSKSPADLVGDPKQAQGDLQQAQDGLQQAKQVLGQEKVQDREVPIMPLNSENDNLGKSQNSGQRKNSSQHSNKKLGQGKKLGKTESTMKSGGKKIPDFNKGTKDTKEIRGILETRDGHGVLRVNYAGGAEDAYISNSQIKRFNLREGDIIEGLVREPKNNERYWGLLKIEHINEQTTEDFKKLDRPKFHSLTPVFPQDQIRLEIGEEPISLRIIDLIAPIGKGQRSLIVSPPKAGKTTLLKNIATGAAANHPEIHLMAVLVGERPEEVTDIRRHIANITNGQGEVAASNFDESPESQCSVAELALERAKRLVEMGKEVLILLDSITRLARAYNLSIPTSGRTLSGGFDPMALYPPKKFFGAARNFEVPGSLTIVGTSLVDTGSRMDDLIYEEFKGTGNQEIHLNRKLSERRIYPAIDIQRSGTRRDDLLLDGVTYQSVVTLQRMLDTLDDRERTSAVIAQLRKSKSNKEFLAGLKQG